MMMSCRSLVWALQLLLSTSAFAQDVPLTECDTYAASDMDPQRKAVGIAFDKVNPELAIPACEAAVQQYPDSSRIRYQLGRAYEKANNFESAVAQYEKAAHHGHAGAQNNLGNMYAKGQGVPRDYAQALSWLRKAADQGLAAAQGNLGVMYAKGQGVPQDYAEALKWYRLAADQGNAWAQNNIGEMYQIGQGVPQDYAEALKWFRKAADQGLAVAQYNLGWMYEKGVDVAQDYMQALAWYRKAADQGHAWAETALGSMYGNGLGVPQDYAGALMWYRKAADQGHAWAETALGLMYGNGHGVPRDYAQALSWLRKAADQGLAAAQYNLGNMYAKGQGVPRDHAQALAWFRKAADQGHAGAQSYIGQEKHEPPSPQYSQASLPDCNDPEVIQIAKKLTSTSVTGNVNRSFVDMLTVDRTQGMGINNNNGSKYCRALFRCDMNVAREAERGVHGQHPLQAACYRFNQAADSGNPAWVQFELKPDGSGGWLATIMGTSSEPGQ
jgi:TPR repeat protein